MTLKPDAFIGFYPCHDLAATTAFYRALGLEVARDQGSCVIFRVARNGYVGFCQHDRASTGYALPQHALHQHTQHPGLILTLVLDDVDGAYRYLSELGVPTEAPPKLSERFGIYHFFARDPNGYRLELQRFLEPL